MKTRPRAWSMCRTECFAASWCSRMGLRKSVFCLPETCAPLRHSSVHPLQGQSRPAGSETGAPAAQGTFLGAAGNAQRRPFGPAMVPPGNCSSRRLRHKCSGKLSAQQAQKAAGATCNCSCTENVCREAGIEKLTPGIAQTDQLAQRTLRRECVRNLAQRKTFSRHLRTFVLSLVGVKSSIARGNGFGPPACQPTGILRARLSRGAPNADLAPHEKGASGMALQISLKLSCLAVL